MKTSATRVPAVFAAFLFVLASGCSHLKDPVRPIPHQVHPNYTTPDSALHAMAVGLARKDATGRALYLGAIADSLNGDPFGFHAAFSEADWVAYVGLKPSDWGYQHEESFCAGLVALFPGRYEMVWAPDESHPQDETLAPNRVLLHRHYLLREIGSRDTVLVANGYADLEFARVATRWMLVRWSDRLDPTVGFDPQQPTMGWRRLTSRDGG
jgi:hypothetical protein